MVAGRPPPEKTSISLPTAMLHGPRRHSRGAQKFHLHAAAVLTGEAATLTGAKFARTVGHGFWAVFRIVSLELTAEADANQDLKFGYAIFLWSQQKEKKTHRNPKDPAEIQRTPYGCSPGPAQHRPRVGWYPFLSSPRDQRRGGVTFFFLFVVPRAAPAGSPYITVSHRRQLQKMTAHQNRNQPIISRSCIPATWSLPTHATSQVLHECHAATTHKRADRDMHRRRRRRLARGRWAFYHPVTFTAASELQHSGSASRSSCSTARFAPRAYWIH